MSEESTVDSGPKYPITLQVCSLYYVNSAENSDKEYHLQLLQVSKDGYRCDYQFGRRGTKLNNKSKSAGPVSMWAARRDFDNTIQTQTTKGYEQINLQNLSQVFSIMACHDMDSAGIDLFINKRGEPMSLGQYAIAAGGAAKDMLSVIQAYSARKEANTYVSQMRNIQIDPTSIVQGLSQATDCLQRLGLEKFGVFVGYQDQDENVYMGVPTDYLEAASAASGAARSRSAARP